MIRHIFSALAMAAGLAFWLSCADLERSNPLDPKNPDSFNKQVVLAEIFVNDSVWVDSICSSVFQNSSFLEAAAESLFYEFTATRLVYAQYHIGEQYHDSLDMLPNLDYYRPYVTANGDLRYAVPDAFINGPFTRLQGATSLATIYTRMREAVTRVLDQRCAFTIEGTYAVDTTAAVITVHARIARLGETDSPDNLKVQYIVVHDCNWDDHHLIVRHIVSVPLPSIAHGDIYQVPAQSMANTKNLRPATTRVIVCIKDNRQAVVQAVLLFGDE
jgi:hypothetical protein